MAAAFERAKAALDSQLAVKNVLQRRGSRVDLLLDTLLDFRQLNAMDRFWSYRQARLGTTHMTIDELLSRPLLTALQQGVGRCVGCSPLGRLVIQSSLTVRQLSGGLHAIIIHVRQCHD